MVAKLRHVWARRQSLWRRELTLRASLSKATVKELIDSGVAGARLDQPWISAKEKEGGGFGIGCEVCFRMLDTSQVHLIRTEMATFSCTTTRKDLLRKHQASHQHQKAVLRELGVEVGPKGYPLVGAPPLEVFSEVLAKVQSGESARKIDQGGTGDRIRNIRFCLLEALQEQDRDFLKRASTMVLLRDERHGRLLIRYAACTRNLETRRGTLGVMRDYGSPNADNLVKATKKAFKQFCTQRLGKPRTMTGLEEPEVDRDLLHHMRMILEMLVNDSASSELLAAEVSRGRRGSEEGLAEAFTPNVRIVGRDLAHCARHVLKKPWQADPTLSNLFETTIWHKRSVVQIIDHSDVFRQWFKDYSAQVCSRSGTPHASNLSSAKHRFESCSKPLGRFILNLVAVFKTCSRIAISRDSSHEGGLVRNWLGTVSSEDLLQLALLADAADEGLVLVRSMDREQLDLATLHATVGNFVERVDFLFKRGGCMTVESSFTQHCLTLLSSGQLQVLEHDTHRVLLSPREDQVQKCISRMSTWADMAKAVVEAEFPDFLAVNAFAVFALADEDKAVAEVPVSQTHCQRLAKLFSVDAHALASQVARHRPTAQAIKNSTKCSNQEAWQKTVQRGREVRASAGWMLDALQPVVMRYLVWSSSTAGVEQRFSVGDRLGVERTPSSQVTESLTLRAVFDKVSAEERKTVVRRAQELFAEGCPRTRNPSRHLRRDKGIKRLLETKASTETGWLARRRSTVSVGARLPRTHSLVGAGQLAELPQGLGREQLKCLAKQQQKKRKREEEAFQDDCLLDHEITDELRVRVKERQEKDETNDRTRITTAARKKRRLAMMDRQVPWRRFVGKKAWVDFDNRVDGDFVVVRGHLAQQGIDVLGPDDWAQAHIFVVADLRKERLRERILWRAALAGCWLLSVTAAMGKQGIFVKYKPAVHKACGVVFLGVARNE